MPVRSSCVFFVRTLCTDAGSQLVRFFVVDTLHKRAPPTESVGGARVLFGHVKATIFKLMDLTAPVRLCSLREAVT